MRGTPRGRRRLSHPAPPAAGWRAPARAGRRSSRPTAQASWAATSPTAAQPGGLAGHQVDRRLHHRRERRGVGHGLQPVREQLHRHQVAAEQAGDEHVEQHQAADLDQPEGGRLTMNRQAKDTHTASSDRHRQQRRSRSGRSASAKPKKTAPKTIGTTARDSRRPGGPAEVGGQPGQLQVDRPGQVDRDVAGADPVGQLGPGEDHHDRDQALRHPGVGRQAGRVVAGHGAAGRVRDAEQDRQLDDAEDGVDEHAGERCLPVGRPAPEAGSRQRHGGTHGDADTVAGAYSAGGDALRRDGTLADTRTQGAVRLPYVVDWPRQGRR